MPSTWKNCSANPSMKTCGMNVAGKAPSAPLIRFAGSRKAIYPAPKPIHINAMRPAVRRKVPLPISKNGDRSAMGKTTLRSCRNPSPIETNTPAAIANSRITNGRCGRRTAAPMQASAPIRKGALEKSRRWGICATSGAADMNMKVRAAEVSRLTKKTRSRL